METRRRLLAAAALLLLLLVGLLWALLGPDPCAGASSCFVETQGQP